MTQTTTLTQAPLRITVIDPRIPVKAKLRVAAYARVSSDSEDQINSYLAQVDYYSKHISANDNWELVDIYADEGLTGTESEKRDNFNRMMRDCHAGKIDRVLCKSISRFARNTKEYIQFMRELLRLGISIHFAKENIDTGKMTSEQIADVYGAFAQMESTNHSSNMQTSYRMRMERGIFTPSSVPYGYHLVDLELEPIPEEAWVVRSIFRRYLGGQGIDDIAKSLNQEGVPRGHGRELWYPSTVSYILTNISYTGDMIWQKTCTTNTFPFHTVHNRGLKPQFYAESCHPALISHEDYNRVQELMAARRGQYQGGMHSTQSIYSKHIFCGECGAVCRRKVTRGKAYWVCNRHDTEKARCSVSQIPETEITAAVLRLYNKLAAHGAEVLQPLLERLKDLRERELRSNKNLSDLDKELARLSEQNLVLNRLKSKGYVDSALYLSQQDEIAHQLRNLRKLRRGILESSAEDRQITDTETILDYLEEHSGWQEDLDEDLFQTLIERLVLLSGDRLKVRLVNGLELIEMVERSGR